MSFTDRVRSLGSQSNSEIVRTVGVALLIALVIRAFFFQPFNIPSGSMKPTLLIGDYLFVSKFSYGYSKHSLPFSPDLFSGRIMGSEPARGDVVVFKTPQDNRTDFIKRLVGLPGDKIQVRNSVLHINGTPVKRERIEDFIERFPNGNVRRIPQYRETMPNGVSYNTLDDGLMPVDNTQEFRVPINHYFMMGDNRDHSNDSRLDVGYVPFENFVGRADVIFFSTDQSAGLLEFWKWPSATRWGRIFDLID
ncbi:MAG: signal peptidase I [Parvibaculaceae bacterium]|nr:signal peptidase I [Parvibaculaceae bacterium]